MRVPFLLLLVACGPALSDAGANVRLAVGDPPATCVEIGHVETTSGSPKDATLKNELRNKTAARGGNFVRMERLDQGPAVGTAYRCPPGVAEPWPTSSGATSTRP